MQSKEVSFYEWQRRFSSEKKCLNHLLRQRWPNGFVCPRCQFQRGHLIARRRVYECVSCRRQTSVTAGTVFHSTKLPLSKWFWALYWVSTDKGGISALRLQKLVGVSWPTAFSMLRKLRRSMGERDRGYRLMNELIELDDAFVGGKRSGKRGRGGSGSHRHYGGLRGTRWKPPFCCHGGGRNTQSGQGQRLRPASTHPRTGDSYRCRSTSWVC